MKAQQPLLGVKKRGGEEEAYKSFRREILWAVQNCIQKWNRKKKFFWQKVYLFLDFFKGLFRTFLFSSGNLESCPELYLNVKSENKNLFFREDFLDLDFFRSFLDFSFRREISRAVQNSVPKWNRTNKNPRIRGAGGGGREGEGRERDKRGARHYSSP